MNRKLVVASNNKHKISEIKDILSKLNIEVISLREANIDVDVEEDGITFMENACKKAQVIFDMLKGGAMVLADDSGIAVDALDGAPGVFSARFAGEHGNDKKNNEKLLKLMEGKQNRKAKFVCAMVLFINKNTVIKVQGEVHGVVAEELKGHEGFGYDPVFYIPQYGKTFGELSSTIKNTISHRAQALSKLEDAFKEYLQEE
ncbi:XTP/dITP diphosphatase [Clostridium peptidivorans]|uniref:XTP/dITP diphosphatase n=1 Tax=Clostridium peptidivorans TaxID=100174 RepID=UPI000BE31C66|nr:XTP/dITP diphosphatase [Clostridium peptidivorans]